jgi:hypothetical protein
MLTAHNSCRFDVRSLACKALAAPATAATTGAAAASHLTHLMCAKGLPDPESLLLPRLPPNSALKMEGVVITTAAMKHVARAAGRLSGTQGWKHCCIHAIKCYCRQVVSMTLQKKVLALKRIISLLLPLAEGMALPGAVIRVCILQLWAREKDNTAGFHLQNMTEYI